MRPWSKRSNSMGRNAKVARLREPKHIVLWEGLLEIYGEHPDRGHIATDLLDPMAIRLAVPALTQTHSDADIADALERMRAVQLIEDAPQGVRLVGYDEAYWPGCSRCHKPNPDDRFSKCPTCRGSADAAQGAATADNGDAPAGQGRNPGSDATALRQRRSRARAAPEQSQGSAPAQREERRREGEEKRGDVPVPSLDSRYVTLSAQGEGSGGEAPTAEAAPRRSPRKPRAEGPEKAGAPEPEKPGSPESDGSVLSRFEAALLECGWHATSSTSSRRTLIRGLINQQALTLDAIAELWAYAKQIGKDPRRLFASWIDRATWKDVLAENDSKAKHERLMAEGRAAQKAAAQDIHHAANGEPRPARDVVGEIYGEKKTQ